MENNVSVFASIVAGILTFASPCVLPLIPAYISFIAGTDARAEDTDSKTSKTVLRALAFVFGFSFVFVLFGAGAGYFGSTLGANIKYFRIAGGVLVILLGLHLAGLKFKFLYKQARYETKKAVGYVSAVLVGMAFAFAWTPCVGPVLAVVLVIAGTEGSAVRGVALLSGYSIGLGIPFILSAAFINVFFKFFNGIKKYLGVIEVISGIFLIVVGILIITGGFEKITIWLLQIFS